MPWWLFGRKILWHDVADVILDIALGHCTTSIVGWMQRNMIIDIETTKIVYNCLLIEISKRNMRQTQTHYSISMHNFPNRSPDLSAISESKNHRTYFSVAKLHSTEFLWWYRRCIHLPSAELHSQCRDFGMFHLDCEGFVAWQIRAEDISGSECFAKLDEIWKQLKM